MTKTDTFTQFSELALPEAVQRAVQSVGYETPTPIQQQTIPPLISGHDVLGHAPTGTGKTAAFALPILARMDLNAKGVQALVLAPTRELAIQVAEAFTKYASQMKNLRVLPIYGGQDYTGQIRQLNRGVNIVVGTPGRIMDHMRRGTLKLDKLQTLVLDEADEMLRMGFIDDVEWILDQTPATRQMALFSATMPSVIKRIANKHLKSPVEITIEGRLTTAATIRQRFWMVSGLHKLDALTRILEAEAFDAMLVFVRTRNATVELAEKLTARGFAASAMNGDMPQKQREQMVDKLRRGKLDILVATDVVARGLDVERISHVINYDIPYDTEAYVHRIGRTGRAGRSGDAILFVTQRERHLLGSIERATRQKIETLQLPTVEMVNNKRIGDFKQRIADTLAGGELAYLQRLVEEFSRDHDVPPERVGAALAKLCMGDQPLLLSAKPERPRKDRKEPKPGARQNENASGKTERQFKRERSNAAPSRTPGADKKQPELGTDTNPKAQPHTADDKAGKSDKRVKPVNTRDDASLNAASKPSGAAKASKPAGDEKKSPVIDTTVTPGSRAERRRAAEIADIELERFRVEVGSSHGVQPENLVGAIANEAGLDSEFIGRIKIEEKHSFVELPAGMPKFLLKDLKRVWVCNHQLNITRIGTASNDKPSDGARASADGNAAPKKRKPRTSGKNKSAKDKKTRTVSNDLASGDTAAANEKREKKKKERHRTKKNKGKRTPQGLS
ncbi:MAG: DEAD/DEAH box helicase [Granulosicoccus sp.]